MRLTVIVGLLASLLLPAASPAQGGRVRAGVAAVDATWHVGASAGQHASTAPGDHGVDPSVHSVKNAPSYGVQSRLDNRALVIEGRGGDRFAVVKTDLYIPQDLLYRRAAQILEERGTSGITRSNLAMTVSHDHSSPFYSSTSPGVWTFQDVYDIRFFEYEAQRIAEAVERAAADLRPVRIGAGVRSYNGPQRNALGPAIADDGSPAGFPNSYSDNDLTVMRLDDVSVPGKPRPLALLVNYSLHPEFLGNTNLISADYVAPLQRMVDRATGAMMVFTQAAVGSAEPERSSYHSVHRRLELVGRNYAQAELGARSIADNVLRVWRGIGKGRPRGMDPARFVPFTTTAKLRSEDRWFPGPLSHPYPGATNCRTDQTLAGNVQVEGLPNCRTPANGANALLNDIGISGNPVPEASPIDPGVSTDDLQAAGIPVPENQSYPSYAALQEDVSVHLQAFALGDILFTICSCEQWADQSRNIKTRTNRTAGDQFLGYDWASQCTRNADGTWTCPDPTKRCEPVAGGRICPDPANPDASLEPISDHEWQRMRAQVANDAAGWNDPEYVLQAESEPVDPAAIKGNYTHSELGPEHGYRLTVPMAMANDYNGYIATYREYQRGDHYRKALTAWGPHSSDYLATRLVAMGGHLNGGPDLPAEPLQEKVETDLAVNDSRAAALGRTAATAVAAYEASLPDDPGPVVAFRQPEDVERFSAAVFSWNGGSNFTDDANVHVQRRHRGRFRPFAGGSGEVPATLKLPDAGEAASYRLGGRTWTWTATFEAFAANFAVSPGQRATPAGTYRFVVDGHLRRGGRVEPYRVVSRPFAVRPWSGITAEDVRIDARGNVSYRVGPRRTIEVPQVEVLAGGAGPVDEDAPKLAAEIGPIDYPDSYEPVGNTFIRKQRSVVRDPAAPNDPSRFEWYCFSCSFRPWADTGDAVRGTVEVVRGGRTLRLRAVRRGDRWVARGALCGGGTAEVPAGGVVDRFGNINGAASAAVQSAPLACAREDRSPRVRPVRRTPSVTG